MSASPPTTTGVATQLSRNPLGIIALFIVLAEVLTVALLAFNSNVGAPERIVLVVFLVAFPVLVLAVFTWLISRHNDKLYAPSDFKDEGNFMKLQHNLTATASLAAALSERGAALDGSSIESIVDAVIAADRRNSSVPTILWVDDDPTNNLFEVDTFRSLGFEVVTCTTTDRAESALKHGTFSAIISDMERDDDPRAGYTLLDSIRSHDNLTPLYFYTGRVTPERVAEALEHRGNGATDDPVELISMVTQRV